MTATAEGETCMLHSKKRLKILHVVGAMNRAGTETWLMQVLRHIDRARFHMDFLVHTTCPSDYDSEISLLGSRIIPCLGAHTPWVYARNFLKIMRENGPYDIVHSHVHHFSALPLTLARVAGVPVRIAHSHSDTRLQEPKMSYSRRVYTRVSRVLIKACATHGLGVSNGAAACLFGEHWHEDRRWQILYCGVDLRTFARSYDGNCLRRELGISDERLVIGHVGRFVPAKNHELILAIAREVIRHEPRALFLLVGDGPLRSDVEMKVTEMGLESHFRFPGVRSDVAALLTEVMDVFLFPSRYEGLPIALIEAQAAGLPCVVSDVVTTEAIIVKDKVWRVPAQEGAAVWAKTILQASKVQRDRSKGYELVCNSPFNIERSVSELCKFYQRAYSESKLGACPGNRT